MRGVESMLVFYNVPIHLKRGYVVKKDVLFAIRRRRGGVIRMGLIMPSHAQAARMTVMGIR